MKKIIAISLVGLFFLSGFGAGVLSDSTNTTDNEWTVMYYLNGDNLLSTVQADRLSYIGAVGSSDQVKVTVLIDQNTDGDTRLYYLEGTELVQQDWPSESNMADAETIQQFALKVKNDFASEHYYLHISSNRGSGWQGICWDETDGNSIMISYPDLLDALNQVTDDGADKLDIIGIETCMGGMTEDAYQLKSVADYFVAYEDCGIGAPKQYVFPLDTALAELIANPDMTPETFATIIPDLFTPLYIAQLKLKTVLAATDLSEMDALADAIDTLADLLIQNIDEYRDEIHNAITNTRIIGEAWDIDFILEPMQFLEYLSIDNPEIITAENEVIDCYNSAVMNKKHLEDDHVCGLSLYIPRRKVDYDRNFRDNAVDFSYENMNFAIDTHWDEFLKVFLEIAGNTPPNTPSITGPSEGQPGTEYEYQISAFDPENDEISYFIDWGDGTDSGWFGPYESGEEIEASHIWTEKGSFEIKVKAKDIHGLESEWSDPLVVSMPKNKLIGVFTLLFEKLVDYHPFLHFLIYTLGGY